MNIHKFDFFFFFTAFAQFNNVVETVTAYLAVAVNNVLISVFFFRVQIIDGLQFKIFF